MSLTHQGISPPSSPYPFYSESNKRRRLNRDELDPEIWKNLPRDILQVIAKFLKGKDRFYFLNLNRTLRSLTSSTSLGSNIFLKPTIREITFEILSKLKWFHGITWYYRLIYNNNKTIITFFNREPPEEFSCRQLFIETAIWILTRRSRRIFRSPFRNLNLYGELARLIERFAPNLLGYRRYWYFIPPLTLNRDEERISYLTLKSCSRSKVNLNHPLIRRCRQIKPTENDHIIGFPDIINNNLIYFRTQMGLLALDLDKIQLNDPIISEILTNLGIKTPGLLDPYLPDLM